MPVKVIMGKQRLTSSSRYETVFLDDCYGRNRLLADRVGTGKRVLELGCSTGYISRRLKEAGCYVVGVEVDEEAARSASHFCDRVVIANLNQKKWVGYIGDRFDVIVMGDVLEHTVIPDETLREVASLLHPNGYVVISLPNVVHWIERIKILLGRFDYEPSGILDFTHLRFFTLSTARALIENTGYQIIDFHPVIGGRLSSHLRPVWQLLAKLFPGLFSYQFLFRAKPIEPLGEVPGLNAGLGECSKTPAI